MVGVSDRCVSARTESVATGVRVDSADGVCGDPILEEFWRTRELWGDVGIVAEGRVELSLGVGLTLLDGLGAGVESADCRLDCDCVSRRRAAMRSTMDCLLLVLRSEMLGDALSAIGPGDESPPIRLPMLPVALEPAPLRDGDDNLSPGELLLWEPIAPPTEGLLHERVRPGSDERTDGRDGEVVTDLSWLGDGLDRKEGADRFGLTEVLGRLGLTDGLDRSNDGLGRLGLTDGLDRLNDGLGRLGLTEGLGLGATDLDRLDMRFCMPLGPLDRGADWAIADGPRLICGLGADRNDGEPIEPPRLLTGGAERICGEGCALGAELLAPIREDIFPPPRDCPQACGPAVSVIPTATAATNKPRTRFLGFQGPAARQRSFSLTANIEILLSPRR